MPDFEYKNSEDLYKKLMTNLLEKAGHVTITDIFTKSAQEVGEKATQAFREAKMACLLSDSPDWENQVSGEVGNKIFNDMLEKAGHITVREFVEYDKNKIGNDAFKALERAKEIGLFSPNPCSI